MKYPIFKQVPLIEQSLMQRLLKQQPEDNAILEVNNLLATTDIQNISESDIKSISQRYKVNLVNKFSLNLEEFYAVLLNYALNDKHLSKDEVDDLEHLKNIFQLDTQNISQIHLNIGKGIYQKSFEEAIADGILTKEELLFLENLETTLQLPKEIADKISFSVRETFFDKSYQRVIEDNRITPDEEREILALSKNLNIKISRSDKSTLERLKAYWAYENLELPVIVVDTKLQKNEVCYFLEKDINWYEEREALKKKYAYSKTNERKEIIINNLKFIEKGDVLFTNKRILFSNSEKTASITYDKIITVSAFKDGLEIDKLTGRSPIYKIEKNSDIAVIILRRLLKENSL